MQATIRSFWAMPAGSVSVMFPLAASTNDPIFGTPQAIS